MFLSMRAHDEQSSLVFSGVFSMVWIGEAIVTLQIKLLGGNMYGSILSTPETGYKLTCLLQLLLPVRLYYRLYPVPSRHRLDPQRLRPSYYRAHPGLSCSDCLVSCRRHKHPRRIGSCQEPGWHCCLPSAGVLHFDWLSMLHQLDQLDECDAAICIHPCPEILVLGHES